jgi:hypothetical protein
MASKNAGAQKRSKVAMVAPVPSTPTAMVSLSAEIIRLGGGRPYQIVDEKPSYWMVHFLGDSEPTKIQK